jgi:hypothetical protein
MSYGNARSGLLPKIIREMRIQGAEESHNSDYLTQQLIDAGHWAGRSVGWPERTVNSYLSQNPEIFERVDDNTYRLRPHMRSETALLWGSGV